MSELFCINCGSRLEPGSVFCENCGTPVDEVQASQVIRSQQQQRKWPIFVVVAIVIMAVIVAVIFFTQGDDVANDQKASTKQEQADDSPSNESLNNESSKSVAPSDTYSAPYFPYVDVSSVLAPDSTTRDYGGSNATDGVLETAWNEGAPGDGSGEWIEFRAQTPQHVSSVSIAGGYPKPYKDGSDVYYKNNRPKQITIEYEGGSQTYLMQDLRGQFQTFNLPHAVDTEYIAIIVDSVYPGSNYNDCCIAEVKFS